MAASPPSGPGRAERTRVEDRVDDRFADRQPAHQALGAHQIFSAHRRLRPRLVGAGRVEQDVPLGLAVGIADVDLHQKAVELRFRQRIGAFLLERVLRRQHVERPRQIVAGAGDGDVLLLHRLQQRRLRARCGAVDLVGHQQLREHRAGQEAEAALAARALFQHFGAENVGRHQIRRELDAPRIEAEHGAHGLDQLGLGEAGNAEQEAMAAGQDRDERLLDHLVLAEDDGADRGFGGAHVIGGRLRGPHDHVFQFLDPFTAGSRHGQLLGLNEVGLNRSPNRVT